MGNSNIGKGIFFAVGSQLLWGIIPLYWKLLSSINAFQILGFRVLISAIFISILLLSAKNTNWITILKEPRERLFLLASSFLITSNWGMLIWAVNSGHTLEGSLGNYLNPLVYIILGMIFFRERLTFLQWSAFILAAISVILLTVFSGKFPWVSICLALTFGFYGLIKKKVNMGALETLGTETFLSIPVAIILLLVPVGGISAIMSYGTKIWITLLFVGVITTTPLYCFSRGAKYLPLSIIGFIQFITPTMHFGLGVFVFHESFPPRNFLVFILIWIAVILYCISYILPPSKKQPPGLKTA